MSVKNLNKAIIVTDSTIGQNIAVIHTCDYENMKYSKIIMEIPIQDVMIINAIYEAIDNEHEVQITNGYTQE